MTRTLFYVAPSEGGVAAVADGAVRELRRRGWDVRDVRLGRTRAPVLTAAQAFWRNRSALRRADGVLAEFGLLDAAVFWWALLATALRRDLVAVAHDAPRLALAPGAGLLRGGGRLRDIVSYRMLSPALDRGLRAVLTSRVGAGVTLSPEAGREWLRRGLAHWVGIEHGADPPRADRVDPSAGTHVLFAGYLGPSKGLDVLLDAWAEIGPGASVPLVIAGSGNGGSSGAYEQAQRERSRSLDPQPQWLGRVTDEDFARLFATAALVVVPYRRSNPASGVLVRALVEGRPVVATRVPAALATIEDGKDGLLVDTDDRGQLALAVRSLLDDARLRDRLGASAASRAAARFTWTRHVEGLESALELAAR